MKTKKMSKTIICFAIGGLLTAYCTLQTANCFAQQGVSINTIGNAADASAILDVSSLTKGLLIPRVILPVNRWFARKNRRQEAGGSQQTLNIKN